MLANLLKCTLCLVVAAIAGCAVFSTDVAPRVAAAVKQYCAEPLSERLAIRQQVNESIKPNAIKVTCEGDPP